MSNSFSILHNYDNVALEESNFDLIQKATAYKQTKLDTNRDKLQSALDQYSSLDFVKDVDRNYAEKRIQAVTDIANKYANGDLSSNALTNAITQNLKQIVDDNVMNAVISSRVYRREQSEWEDARKNSPDKYSQMNHQYAMQAAAPWLSSDQVGARYNGGGGFIEYRDINKKLMENLPKITEALKAKKFSTGPSSGFFQYQNTYEVVPREHLSAALDAMLDEKDKQQLRINAWAKYKDATPEQMKYDWDQLTAPDLAKANSDIEGLRVLRAKAKSKDEIASIDADIASKNQQIEDISNNDFNTIFNTFGKDGAGAVLYSSSFKDGILDAYTAPRLMDRKIDEVQKENVLFQQKLKEFDLSEKKFELEGDKFELDKAKLLQKTTEMNLKYGLKNQSKDKSLNNASDETIITGKTETLANPSAATPIQLNQRAEKQAWDGLISLGVKRGEINKTDFADLSEQFTNLEDLATKGGSVTVGGKEIKVTADNVVKLRNFRDRILETSPAEQEIHDKFDTVLFGGKGGGQSVIGNLTQLAKAKIENRDVDFDYNELPKFNWKFVEDKKTGKLKKVDAQTDNPYAYYIAKKAKGEKLSEADETTLKAYVSIHAIGDEELDMPQEVRAEMYKNFKYKTLARVSSSEFQKIAPSLEAVVASTNNNNLEVSTLGMSYEVKERFKVRDELKKYGIASTVQDFGQLAVAPSLKPIVVKLGEVFDKLKDNPSSQSLLVEKNNLTQQLQTVKKSQTSGTNLSDIIARDTEFNNKKGKEISLTGFDKMISNAVESIQSPKVAPGLETEFAHLSYNSPIITPKNPNYGRIKALAVQQGKISDSYKGNLEVTPLSGDEDEEGKKFSNTVTIKAIQKNSKGEIESIVSDPIPLQDFVRSTGFQIEKPEMYHYDANKGKYARSISLGSGMGKNDAGYVGEKLEDYINFIRDNNSAEMQDAIQAYRNGEFTFKLEPRDNVYKQVIYRNGREVAAYDTLDDHYTDQDYVSIVKSMPLMASSIMGEYLDDLKNSLEQDYKIQNTQAKNNTLLGQ